jgi:hypothetical protein
MKSPYSILGAIAVAVATSAAIGLAQMASSAKAPTRHQVVVSEDVLNPLIGEPEHHFHQAASLFTDGDHQGAAAEIRTSAALLSLEAGRGSAENRSGLSSSAAELDDLAARVERGDVASRSELNLAFARADLALAAHYRAMADNALANKEHDNAGRWLKAAADSVDDAAGWAGQQPPTAQVQARDQVNALAAKIRNGTNWSYEEAKKGVGYLGSQIQYLGAQMQTLGSSPTSGNAEK